MMYYTKMRENIYLSSFDTLRRLDGSNTRYMYQSPHSITCECIKKKVPRDKEPLVHIDRHVVVPTYCTYQCCLNGSFI